MKNLLHLFILGFVMVACTDLDSLEPFQKDTFIKYYGDPGNNTGIDLEVTDNSYAILALNTNGTLNSARLFTTDLLGNNVRSASANEVWNNFIPSDLHYSGDGFLVIGDYINPESGEAALRLVMTNNSLDVEKTYQIDSAGIDFHGRGVIVSSSSEIVISGFYEVAGQSNSFVAGLDSELNDIIWQSGHKPVNSKLEISKSLYQQGANGTRFISNQLYEINTLEAELRPLYFNRNGTIDDNELQIADPGFIQTTGDFVPANSASGYLFAYSFQATNGSRIELINNTGKRIPIKPDEADYFANSLVSTSSGEVVILGSQSVTNTDTDLFITRVNTEDGTLEPNSGFELRYGGTGRESGVAIQQTIDGGFIILGNLQNTNDSQVLLVMKVNKNGQLVN